MGQIDDLINQPEIKNEKNDSSLSSNSSERNTLLSIVSIIIVILGGIIVFMGVILLFMYFDKTWHEERLYASLGSIVIGTSLLFYGLIGKCLDDIRKNTKK